jgi:hypothetical protein
MSVLALKKICEMPFVPANNKKMSIVFFITLAFSIIYQYRKIFCLHTLSEVSFKITSQILGFSFAQNRENIKQNSTRH